MKKKLFVLLISLAALLLLPVVGLAYNIDFSASPSAWGSVECKVNGLSSTTAEEGDTVTLTATPENADFKFDAWNFISAKPSDASDINAETITFTMPSEDVVIAASFLKKATVDVNEADWGTAELAYWGVSYNATLLYIYPNAGYRPVRVEATNGSADAIYERPSSGLASTVTAGYDLNPTSYTVIFEPIDYTVTAAAYYSNWGSVTCLVNGSAATTANIGDTVTLTATPENADFKFSVWNFLSAEPSDASDIFAETITFTMPGEDVRVGAAFLKKATIEVNEPAWGTAKLSLWGVPANSTYLHIYPNAGYKPVRVEAANGRANAIYESTSGVFASIVSAENNLDPVSYKVIFEPIDYAITAAAFASTWGSVECLVNGTSAATANIGDTLTLTATPVNADFKFRAWDFISTKPSDASDIYAETITFTMPAEDVRVDATFLKKVTIEVNEAAWGTAELRIWGVPANGTSLYIYPSPGYKPVRVEATNGWADDIYEFAPGVFASNIGEENNLNPTSYTVIFEPIDYTITTIANSPTWGSVECLVNGSSAATANIGDEVTLTATPTNKNFQFLLWGFISTKPSDASDIKAETITFTMPSEDVKVEALFMKKATIEVNEVAWGTAELRLWGVPANGGFLDIYSNAGYKPVRVDPTNGRADDICVLSPGIFASNVNAENNLDPTSYKVIFEPIDYAITATAFASTWGGVECLVNGTSATTANIGDTVTLTAVPANADFKFTAWDFISTEPSDASDIKAETITFTMPAEDVRVDATFLKKVTIEVNEAAWGTAELRSWGVPANGTTLHIYPSPGYKPVRVEATNGWADDIYESAPGVFASNIGDENNLNPTSYKVIFEPIDYIITATANNDSFGSVVAPQGGYTGESIMMEAKANAGYEFTQWEFEGTAPDGVDLGKENIVFAMPPNDIIVTAVFVRDDDKEGEMFTVTARTTDKYIGIVKSGAGEYAAGTEVTVTAAYVDRLGGKFLGWQHNGKTVTLNLSYKFIISEDTSLRAVFVDNANLDYSVLDKLKEAMPWHRDVLPLAARQAFEANDAQGYEVFLAKLMLYYYTHPHYEEERFDLEALTLPEEEEALREFLNNYFDAYEAAYEEARENALDGEPAPPEEMTLTDITRRDWLTHTENKAHRDTIIQMLTHHIQALTAPEIPPTQ